MHRILIVAALLASGAGSTAAAEPREVQLANGIRALLVPDPNAAAVDVATWHRAGIAAETPGQSGASYLLERLALSGAWSPAAARALGSLRTEGGTHGSVTTPDYSSFHETLPPEALGAALRLQAARLSPPQITDAQLARERRLAAETLRRLGDGGPVGRALARLYAEAFQGHPYARRLTGDPARDTLAAAGLKAFARARYGPPETRVTIVGRFDPDSALVLLRRTVGAVPRRAVRTARAQPPSGGARRVEVMGEGSLPILAAAWRLPGGADSARATFPVLSNLLLRDPLSTLQRELATGPSAPFLRLEGAIAEREGATLLYFVAVVKENADTALVGAAVLEAARRLAEREVTPEELERARRQVELARLEERQTTRGRAQALGSAWMVNGSWQAEGELLARVREVTAGEVREAAARVLKPDAFTAVWIMPDPARRGER